MKFQNKWFLVIACDDCNDQGFAAAAKHIAGTWRLAKVWAWQDRNAGIPTRIIPIDPF